MDGELGDDGEDGVRVEYIWQRPLLGQDPQRFGSGDEEEAAGQEKPLEGCLSVTELDSLQVENTLAVGQDQGIEGQDLEHLQGGHQSTPTLLDHVVDARDAGALTGKRSGYGGVSKLDYGGLLGLLQLLQHPLELLLLSGQFWIVTRPSCCVWPGSPALPLLLQLVELVVLHRDGFVEIVFTLLLLLLLRQAGQDGDPHVRVLEGPDIIGPVSTHESGVAEGLETGQDRLLLLGVDPGEDPDVREESPGPGRVGGEEEGERLSGEAEIVTGEEGGPVRPGGVSYSIVIFNVIFNLIVIIVIIIIIILSSTSVL